MTDVPAIGPHAAELLQQVLVQTDRRPENLLDRADCLPSDIDYCLDNEQAIANIACDDRAFVDLFDDDLSWFVPLTLGNAHTFPDVIKARHAAWRQTASLRERSALSWAGLEGLKIAFDASVSDLAYEVIHHHAGSDFPDGAEAAFAQACDVTAASAFRRFLDCARQVVARSVEDIDQAGQQAFLEAHGAIDGYYAEAEDRLRTRVQRLRDLAIEADPELQQLRDGRRRAQAHVAPPTRREEKSLRRALLRSYRLLCSVAGQQTAKACLDGEEILVQGHAFDFRLRVARLRATAHGAIEVFVTDKNAVELANLCVYIDQTPALDQMAALIMHVAGGNEHEIIRRANVIRATPAATENDTFRTIRQSVDHSIWKVPYPGDLGEPERSPAEDLTQLIERRLAASIDSGVWRPLIERLGSKFAWNRFAGRKAEPAAELTAPTM